MVRLITGIRSVRSEMNVPPGARIPMVLVSAPERATGWLKAHEEIIRRLRGSRRRPRSMPCRQDRCKSSMTTPRSRSPLAGVIDVAQEHQRLEKELAKVAKDITASEKKLSNEQYLSKAPPAVVEAEREKLAEFKANARPDRRCNRASLDNSAIDRRVTRSSGNCRLPSLDHRNAIINSNVHQDR